MHMCLCMRRVRNCICPLVTFSPDQLEGKGGTGEAAHVVHVHVSTTDGFVGASKGSVLCLCWSVWPVACVLCASASLGHTLCFVETPTNWKSGKQTGEEKLLGSSSPLDPASPNMMLFRISFGKCCSSLGECTSVWYHNGFHGGFVARTADFYRTGVSKVESATCCSYGTR